MKTAKRVLKWKMAAALAAAACVFFLLIGAFVSVTSGGYTITLVRYLNEAYQVPVEVQGPLKQASEAADVDWALVAGYIQVQYGWTALPIPSRLELAQIPVVEEVPCEEDPPPPPPPSGPPGVPHPVSVIIEPKPDPGDGPPETDPPGEPGETPPPQDEPKVCHTERPPTRDEVEHRWAEQLGGWLPGVVARVGATDGDLTAPPIKLADDKARAALEAAEAARVIDALRSTDLEGLREATDNESYQLVLRAIDWRYTYPVPGAQLHNDWHYERPQNAAMGLPEWHQGTDLFASRGTPILAVTDGAITRREWNVAGGRTVELTDPYTGLRFYYAHLEDWADGLVEGKEVTAGQVIGYIGTSGEGPPGTDHVIQDPHVHLGVYLPSGEVTPPYPYLLQWMKLG